MQRIRPVTGDNVFVGLMSGTSMDGVDGVLARFGEHGHPTTLATVHVPFPHPIKEAFMALQQPSRDELHVEALAGNALAALYAGCVDALLEAGGTSPEEVCAIGAHGQTIRHRPDLGYTRQTNNPALLAELTGIDVIADFRARDVAAGGQGAPLVPAFHETVFRDERQARAIVNVGGIANVTILHPGQSQDTKGFDTGPGNALMDLWINRCRALPFDESGRWAASGNPILDLLESLMEEQYFRDPPPKSTGRDLFHEDWLQERLARHATASSEDVQATLNLFTARTIAESIHGVAPDTQALYVCGGGAFNAHLLGNLELECRRVGMPASVMTTEVLGAPPLHVEALAFAWMAYRFRQGLPANLPGVTGAQGARVLGALYPG